MCSTRNSPVVCLSSLSPGESIALEVLSTRLLSQWASQDDEDKEVPGNQGSGWILSLVPKAESSTSPLDIIERSKEGRKNPGDVSDDWSVCWAPPCLQDAVFTPPESPDLELQVPSTPPPLKTSEDSTLSTSPLQVPKAESSTSPLDIIERSKEGRKSPGDVSDELETRSDWSEDRVSPSRWRILLPAMFPPSSPALEVPSTHPPLETSEDSTFSDDRHRNKRQRLSEDPPKPEALEVPSTPPPLKTSEDSTVSTSPRPNKRGRLDKDISRVFITIPPCQQTLEEACNNTLSSKTSPRRSTREPPGPPPRTPESTEETLSRRDSRMKRGTSTTANTKKRKRSSPEVYLDDKS
ncbi:hypothetical protein JB92DRAFT_3123510 [Gautieria morchelliformis]|nr:hypothetical protein JB92DRAFT_3123510 [Gautieria morchelliformis]